MSNDQQIRKAGGEKAKKTNRSNNNNNKASKDGVDFQYHMFYFVIGLCHDKYDYSARYEGEMDTYGALDDVILKINSNEDGSQPEALYLIQAKQFQKEIKQISLLDLLHPGDGFTKYVESYITYKSSKACEQDGLPTQMIYWTSADLHSTTRQVMAMYESNEDHLKIPTNAADTPIQKLWIKDWKKLFIFEIASMLKSCAESVGKNVDDKKCKCESAAKVLIREAVQQVEVETESGAVQKKLKLRNEFLYRGSSLSKNAVVLRDCLDLAYQTIGKKPDCAKLETRTFNDIFGLDFTSTLNTDTECTFEYKGLSEEELDWFFQHFVYYVNVPKGEGMIKLLSNMFGDNFKEQFFEKHLITNPTAGSSYVQKSFVNSLIKTLELTSKLFEPLVTSVEFPDTKQLRDRIESFLKEDAARPTLTIKAKTNVDWTVSRVVKEVRKISTTCVVVQDKDTKMLSEALCTIEENLIRSEIQTIVAVDLKDLLQLPTGIRMISIVPPDWTGIEAANYFEDEIYFNDIKVNFEQFGDKTISIDEKKIKLTEICQEEVIKDKIENLVELYMLKELEVKSDIFSYDEKHYIERELLEKNKVVAHSALTSGEAQSISIISDTAGQGKTVELLRIARNAQTSLEDTTICLYFRAKTIAKHIPPTNVNSFNAFQYLPTLLHLEPSSSFMEEIVLKCLERYNVILLVDGFDEIVDDSQAVVIKFMKSALEQKSCSLVIATRTEAKSKLESAFKNAKCYTLGKFAYEKYFDRLWLQEMTEPPTEILKSNMEFFIKNFDNLLKKAGCKLFLEVPQFCRIMGTIYQDRIHKPNFKLHNNYEIGAIYDAFVHSQFANAFEGYFDETKLKDIMALRVLRTDFLTKHMELAFYIQYHRCKEANLFKDLLYYDLIVNQDDQYEFIHITVLEYFLARYFMMEDIDMDKHETKEAFLNFLQRYFCVSRANIADKFIDFFLGDEKCNKLSKKKRNVIVRYLQSDRKHLPTFVRTTLNNATFNTLKLLLSIAPEPMLLDLCFRFGSVKQTNDGKKGKGKDAIPEESTENEINLKRLGENQMNLLLQALKESDGGRPTIIKSVLFPSDPNEEDILEVSIRKPFPEVFDEVIKYCTEKCVEDFKNHVEARLERYAQVMVQHCYAEKKERMIDKITQHCKDKLNGSTISGYLQGFDLFKIIVENIEVVTTGKKFIEEDRLDMLGKLLALIDEYVDPGSLALKKEQRREQISSLKNASIKNRLFEWLDE